MPLLAQDPHGRGGRLQEQMMIIGRKEGDNTHKIHSVSNTLNTTYDDDVYVSRNKAAGSCQKRGRLKRWKTRYKSSKIESRRRDNPSAPNQSSPNQAIIPPVSFPSRSIPTIRILNLRTNAAALPPTTLLTRKLTQWGRRRFH